MLHFEIEPLDEDWDRLTFVQDRAVKLDDVAYATYNSNWGSLPPKPARIRPDRHGQTLPARVDLRQESKLAALVGVELVSLFRRDSK